MAEKGRFTTNARSIGRTGELAWGDDAHPWSGEVDTINGVVFEDGDAQTNKSGPDYLDFTSFSPQPPHTYSGVTGTLKSSLVETDFSDQKALEHYQNAKDGSVSFTGTSIRVDLTDATTMHYATKLVKADGQHDGMQVRLNGNVILDARNSTHDWTNRQADVSGYSGTATLSIGHEISRYNQKNIVSRVANIYFE